MDVILAAGKNTGLKLPGMPLTLPDVFAGAHALEYPVSSGAIIDYSLRGELTKLLPETLTRTLAPSLRTQSCLDQK